MPLPSFNEKYPPVPPGSLTAALDVPTSALRTHLQTRFPNRSGLLGQYRAGAGPLLVDTRGANLGTIGTAFEILTDFILDPDHVPALAVAPFAGRRGGADTVLALTGWVQVHAEGVDDVSMEVLARGSWALALCTEVSRAGLFPDSPLAQLRERKAFDTQSLLELASDAAVDELLALHQVALTHLHPHLPPATPARQLHLGPTFAASTLLAADADLVCDGLLLEVKTRLGSLRSRTAGRYSSLSLLELYQVLGYALFDTDDAFGIDRVGWYAARYGHLAVWDLQEFADRLAGRDVDLAAERAAVHELLSADRAAAPSPSGAVPPA